MTERDAAMALYNIKDNIKVTLHFGSTQKSNIDGDWPCLILIFTDNQRYSLRPLFFGYEDRENIVWLIVETYNRLAMAIAEEDVSTKNLREKNDWHHDWLCEQEPENRTRCCWCFTVSLSTDSSIVYIASCRGIWSTQNWCTFKCW